MSRNDTNTETGETDQTVVTTVLGDSTSMGFVKDIGLQWNILKKRGLHSIWGFVLERIQVADRAQVRQSFLGRRSLRTDLQQQHGPERLSLCRGELGQHPRVAESWRKRPQRVEYGAGPEGHE